jgi:acyl carrier protein
MSEVQTVLAMVLKKELNDIPLDASMRTLEDWDSLRQLTLILALEDAFEIEIPDAHVQYLTSVPLIAQWLNADD